MKKLIFALTLFGAFSFASFAEAAATYTVKSGDSLWKISKENSVTLQELRVANDKFDDLIFPGQVLKIPSQTTVSSISAEDKDLLARLIRAEAVGEPFPGKVAVAVVVFNRVDHTQFPNTIKEVIYQDRQFTPVSNGEINKPADQDSFRAVEEAIALRGTGAGSLFFYNPSIATSRWLDSRETTVVIGNHVFKR